MFSAKQSHLKIGVTGEAVALEFLINLGFKIIEKNYRQKYGEIDIIAKSKNGTLRFVEVKTINEKNGFKPEDNLTRNKIEKLKKICSIYANQNQELVGESGWQIDLIAIQISETPTHQDFSHLLTKDGKNYLINLYENIVNF
jgi:putative endonuclease